MEQLFIALYIITTSNILEAENISCDGFEQCMNQQINCTDQDQCIVTCSENNACMGATVNCAGGQTCQVHCLGYHSCLDIIINGGSATELFVYSDYTDQTVLTNSHINCGNVAFCDVKCTDMHDQCNGMIIHAEYARQLVVKCEGANWANDHCTNMDVYCPQSNCWIYPAMGGDRDENMDIFAEAGFNDVQICSEGGTYSSFGSMHCGIAPAYNTSCIIDANSINSCTASSVCDTDNNDICMQPSTQTTRAPLITSAPTIALTNTIATTANPTINRIPSKSPSELLATANPTETPSKLPSEMPSSTIATVINTIATTVNPTEIPSKSPTIAVIINTITTSNPTEMPSKSPTELATKIPTILPSKSPTIAVVINTIPTTSNGPILRIKENEMVVTEDKSQIISTLSIALNDNSIHGSHDNSIDTNTSIIIALAVFCFILCTIIVCLFVLKAIRKQRELRRNVRQIGSISKVDNVSPTVNSNITIASCEHSENTNVCNINDTFNEKEGQNDTSDDDHDDDILSDVNEMQMETPQGPMIPITPGTPPPNGLNTGEFGELHPDTGNIAKSFQSDDSVIKDNEIITMGNELLDENYDDCAIVTMGNELTPNDEFLID